MSGWNLALDLHSKPVPRALHNEFYEALKERHDSVSFTLNGYWSSLPPVYPAPFRYWGNDARLIITNGPKFKHKSGDVYTTYSRYGFIYTVYSGTKNCVTLGKGGAGNFDDGTYGVIQPGVTTVTINSGADCNTGTYVIYNVKPAVLLLENGAFLGAVNSFAGSNINYTINGVTKSDGIIYTDFPFQHLTSQIQNINYQNVFVNGQMLDELRAAINAMRYYGVGNTDGFLTWQYQP